MVLLFIFPHVQDRKIRIKSNYNVIMFHHYAFYFRQHVVTYLTNNIGQENHLQGGHALM